MAASLPEFLQENRDKNGLYMTWVPMGFNEPFLPNDLDLEELGISYQCGIGKNPELSIGPSSKITKRNDVYWNQVNKTHYIPSKIRFMIFVECKEEYDQVNEWINSVKHTRNFGENPRASFVQPEPRMTWTKTEVLKKHQQTSKDLQNKHEDNANKILELSKEIGLNVTVAEFTVPEKYKGKVAVQYDYSDLMFSIDCSKGTWIFDLLLDRGLLVDNFPVWYAQRTIPHYAGCLVGYPGSGLMGCRG